jgi:tRNA pseudouridine38-40 synthase
MRIALGLEYSGAPFTGWQSQPDGRGVQDALERALRAIADAPVRTTAAGRTDTGVHATLQVVHFDSEAMRPETAWVRGVNSHLPPQISVQWGQPVPDDFHARFGALARHYTYLLVSRATRPALLAERVGWYHRRLDIGAMREAATALAGTHDFSAFRAAECQASSPVRTMSTVAVAAIGEYTMFEFTANAFLHHMIRNIVGALVYVGAGKEPVTWIADLLASRDRTRAAPTFAADGLYLTGADYDARWGLPPTRRAVSFPIIREASR